jgi:membrane protein
MARADERAEVVAVGLRSHDPVDSPEAARRARAATGQRRIDRARGAARRHAVRLEDTAVGRYWTRLLEVEFVDRSVALAAKAFVSFFPLLIVVAALSPPKARTSIVETFASRFGISGDVFATVKQAFASADETRAATGVLGALLVVAYAVSFTTALQRVYLRAWRRPPGGGARNKGRGAVWVAGILALMLLLSSVRRLVGGPAGTFTLWALGVIGAVLSWWWTARLMLRGEVRWRPLLPTAVVIGVGGWFYTLAASLWMPRTVSQQFEQFGAFGIALAFVTWFTGFSFLIVGATVLGPVLAEGEDVVGRWLRAGEPSPLEPTAAPPLPGPDRPMRLSDAFGRDDGPSSGVPQV